MSAGVVGYDAAARDDERLARSLGQLAGMPGHVRRRMAGDQRRGKASREAVSREEATPYPASSEAGGEEKAQALGEDAQAPVQLEDSVLVERAKGDPTAFGLLYERHVRSIYAFAFSKVHDQSAAEDVTSQVFLQALRALPRYEDRGVPFRAWLFRITANVITDRLRAARSAETPMPTAPDDGSGASSAPFDPPDPRSEADMVAWEHAEDFTQLIATLSPEQRTVVRLRFAENLPIAAIAREMARSEGAVKMLLMRALQNLRKRMQMETAHD
jgi:RNA polymerase sigma-70 factor (ECF subfamily)